MKDQAFEMNLESILELQDLDLEIMMESGTDDKPSLQNPDSDSVERAISSIFGRLFLLRKKRRLLAESVNHELLGQYEQLRSKKGLIMAIVPVENGICQACKQELPKSTLFLLRKKEPIGKCPSCERFIYLSE